MDPSVAEETADTADEDTTDSESAESAEEDTDWSALQYTCDNLELRQVVDEMSYLVLSVAPDRHKKLPTPLARLQAAFKAGGGEWQPIEDEDLACYWQVYLEELECKIRSLWDSSRITKRLERDLPKHCQVIKEYQAIVQQIQALHHQQAEEIAQDQEQGLKENKGTKKKASLKAAAQKASSHGSKRKRTPSDSGGTASDKQQKVQAGNEKTTSSTGVRRSSRPNAGRRIRSTG